MAQTTPGRRARASTRVEQAYVPFNAKPKEVGTRSGQPMPTDVPRNAAGFEDPDEFFKSPEARVARSIAAHLRTPGRPGPGGGAGEGPPSNAGPSRRSRLSDLGADAEEEGVVGGEDLLVDDDFAGIDDGVPYFSDNNPPSVKIPKKSLLPPASPAVGYDGIPSPSTVSPRKRRQTSGTHRTPTTATSSPVRRRVLHSPIQGTNDNDNVELELGEDLDTTMASQDMAAGLEESADEGDTGVEMGRNANSSARKGRLSTMSRRSRVTIGDREEDADWAATDVGEPSIRYEVENDGGVDMDVEVDIGGNDGYEEDEGAAMEVEEAGNEDEGQEEQEEERVPVRRGPAKKNAPKAAPVRRERRSAEPAGPRQRKTRVSQIHNDGNMVEGDFTMRRSGRQHFRPLEYWRGEKFEYTRGQYGAQIKEVVKIAPDVVEPLTNRYKRGRSGRARSGSTKPSASVDPNEALEGWDELTDPIGVVKEFPSNAEIERRIAFPKHRLDPKEVKDSNFMYQKVFGEDQFIAAGVVFIPVGGKKPGKHSKDNSYVFYVIQGAVQVLVHRTSFVMAPGAMFMVPRGNHYSIENVSPDVEAKLFFAQARKLRLNEAEDEALQVLSQPQTARGSATPNERRNGGLPPVAEDGGDEQGQEAQEVDEEEETPRRKKAKSKGKRR